MKQTFMGLAVIAIALAAAAFTTPKNESPGGPYFFRVDASGNTINSSGIPPTDNFSDCTNSGEVNCSRTYTDYVLLSGGLCGPAGTASPIIKKP
ncbi:MAG: hypothetical protein QM664_12465 [Flavihumibacter sp.]